MRVERVRHQISNVKYSEPAPNSWKRFASRTGLVFAAFLFPAMFSVARESFGVFYALIGVVLAMCVMFIVRVRRAKRKVEKPKRRNVVQRA